MATERQNAKSYDVLAQDMWLRDYFAGQALQGLLSAEAHPQSTGYEIGNEDVFARTAYALADAMLRARGEHA